MPASWAMAEGALGGLAGEEGVEAEVDRRRRRRRSPRRRRCPACGSSGPASKTSGSRPPTASRTRATSSSTSGRRRGSARDADRLAAVLGERRGSTPPRAGGEQRVVAVLGVGVERQVVGGERDVVVEAAACSRRCSSGVIACGSPRQNRPWWTTIRSAPSAAAASMSCAVGRDAGDDGLNLGRVRVPAGRWGRSQANSLDRQQPVEVGDEVGERWHRRHGKRYSSLKARPQGESPPRGDRDWDLGNARCTGRLRHRAGPPDVTDHELVQAVRAGDDHAFERLYHRYHRRITAYIFGDGPRPRPRGGPHAGDLRQRPAAHAPDRPADRLQAVDLRDRQERVHRRVPAVAARRGGLYRRRGRRWRPPTRPARRPGRRPRPRSRRKQELAPLQGAFGGLSDDPSRILVMRELEGLSYAEIGERLGMSRPSVESTLFRARRRLTEEYEELRTGERCLRIQEIIAAAPTRRRAWASRDQRRMSRHVSTARRAGGTARHGRARRERPGAPAGAREDRRRCCRCPAFLRGAGSHGRLRLRRRRRPRTSASTRRRSRRRRWPPRSTASRRWRAG